MHNDLRKCTYRELLTMGLDPATVPEIGLEAIAILEQRLVDERWQIVYRLRRAGESWAEIGDRFGITRQAAQQRFGKFGAQSLFGDDEDLAGSRVAVGDAVARERSERP